MSIIRTSGITMLAAMMLLVLAPGANATQDPPPAPTGWTRTVNPETGQVRYEPKGLRAGEIVHVTYHTSSLLEGRPIEAWLHDRFAAFPAPMGTWASPPDVTRFSANLAHGTRALRDPRGRKGAVMAFGVTADRQRGRASVAVVVPEAIFERHQPSIVKITSALFEYEKSAAVREGRGLDLEQRPPTVAGIEAGGPIRPGRYVGTQVNDNEVRGRFELMIWENGEFQFLVGDDETGHITYSPGTGRLDIDGDFHNSTHDPHEDFCVYGTERDGTPIVYAEDDYGLGTDIFRLRWQNPPDRPSPSESEHARILAEKEAKRYKHVTTPGRGVRPSEIEAVLLTTEVNMDGISTEMASDAYLLMTDGRVMDGLPVPPEDLDVAKSRSREPDRWGWWKLENGEYLFAWPVRPTEFAPPTGTQRVARPFEPGVTLDGTWSSASSWSMFGVGGGASFWGVRLSDAGRFEKFSHGISGSDNLSSSDPSVTVAWDDEGSVVAVVGEQVGGGISRRNNSPEAARMGRYQLNGYTMTLRYDNGTTERLPVFSCDRAAGTIWFEGGALSLDDE